MKKAKFFLLPALAIAAMATISSCDKDKDEMILPSISFKTGAGYTAHDTTVATGTTLLVGINAAKTENEDVLKRFTITRSVNGGTDSTLLTQNLTSAQGDAYSYDYTLNTGNVAGTQLYKFTIVNRDGLVNTDSLKVTVQ